MTTGTRIQIAGFNAKRVSVAFLIETVPRWEVRSPWTCPGRVPPARGAGGEQSRDAAVRSV
jgi:hypothetical protein